MFLASTEEDCEREYVLKLFSVPIVQLNGVCSAQIDCTPDEKGESVVDGPLNVFIDTVKEELNTTNKYILKSYPVY